MVCIEVSRIYTITNYDLTAWHKPHDLFNVVHSQITLLIYSYFADLVFAIYENLSRYNWSNIVERFLGRVYNFGHFRNTHGTIFHFYERWNTIVTFFQWYFATRALHVDIINYYVRNTYLFWERGGLLRAMKERCTSGSKERMSFALVYVSFFISYYEKL